MPVEDEQIIALYCARDERALNETSVQYGTLCRQIAGRILGSDEDAEECWNDVLLRVWNAIPPEKPVHFLSYLVKLTRNAALNLSEKAHAEKRGGKLVFVALDELAECLPAPDDIEEQVSEAELRRILRDFIRTLPEDARNIFILRYVYLLPVREIAERCGIGLSKVKVSLHRTRKALKKHLGGDIL
jgi:RNA polymerase sigma-70 factor (ECF subfamily)